MTLIIKSLGATAPEGAKKLYRDAIIEKGSLICGDFSNRGTLDSFNTNHESKVYDLAKESANELGFTNTGEIILRPNTNIELTQGKGFTLDQPGYEGGTLFGTYQGVNINCQEMMSYLVSKQPRCLFVFWVRKKSLTTYNGRIEVIRSISGGDASIFNIRMNFDDGYLSPSIGGGSAGLNVNNGELIQVGVEFNSGQKNKYYINRDYLQESTSIATGFVACDTVLIGNPIINESNEVAVYRYFGEDLDVSGRNVQDILNKDWDYVHAQGQFEGIVKRPFVDNY